MELDGVSDDAKAVAVSAEERSFDVLQHVRVLPRHLLHQLRG